MEEKRTRAPRVERNYPPNVIEGYIGVVAAADLAGINRRRAAELAEAGQLGDVIRVAGYRFVRPESAAAYQGVPIPGTVVDLEGHVGMSEASEILGGARRNVWRHCVEGRYPGVVVIASVVFVHAETLRKHLEERAEAARRRSENLKRMNAIADELATAG